MSSRLTAELQRWRTEARAHDAAYAEAWQAGYAAHRTDHRRLWVVGIIAAVFLFARRLPLAGAVVVALWAVLLVVALWPLVLAALAVELTMRQHRRWGSTWRTVAYAASWLACVGLAFLAIAARSPWPLVAIPVAIAAWAVESRWRAYRALHPRRLRTAPEEPFPGAGVPVVAPYHVTYTSKAEHVETRRYETGRAETVDTLTGEPASPDPMGRW